MEGRDHQVLHVQLLQYLQAPDMEAVEDISRITQSLKYVLSRIPTF